MITENIHKQIACDNTHSNNGHIKHTYNKDGIVLWLKHRIEKKYSKHKNGPYKITEVHTNGTVTIAQGTKRQTNGN